MMSAMTSVPCFPLIFVLDQTHVANTNPNNTNNKYKCLLSMFLLDQTHAAYEGVKRSGVDQTARNHNGRWFFSIHLNFPSVSYAYAMPSNYLLTSRR